MAAEKQPPLTNLLFEKTLRSSTSAAAAAIDQPTTTAEIPTRGNAERENQHLHLDHLAVSLALYFYSPLVHCLVPSFLALFGEEAGSRCGGGLHRRPKQNGWRR